MGLSTQAGRTRHWLPRALFLSLALLLIFGGCKTQPVSKTSDPGTNTVPTAPDPKTNPVDPPTITNITKIITVTNPVSVSVTNMVLMPSNPVVWVMVTNAAAPAVTNHMDVTTVLVSTNGGPMGASCGCGTNTPISPAKSAEGCKPFLCAVMDIIDHHLKEILSFILALLGAYGGKKIAQRDKDEEGNRLPWTASQIIALGVFLLFIFLVALGVWVFAPASGPSSERTVVVQTVSPPQGFQGGTNSPPLVIQGTNGLQIVSSPPQPAPPRFPWENLVGILAALIAAAAALILHYVRTSSERESINLAIKAEIKRLYFVVKKHLKWRESCAEEEEAEQRKGAVAPPQVRFREPLIDFSYPVYSKHVANIGVLDEHIVEQAVSFYGWVEYLNKFQTLRDEYAKADKLPIFNERYDGMLKDFINKYRDMFEGPEKSKSPSQTSGKDPDKAGSTDPAP